MTDPHDLLARAARELRESPALAAMVPLSAAEREKLADAAITQVLGPRRRRPRWVAAGAAVAMAATIAVVLHRPPATPLPRYAMAVAGEQTVRGAHAAPASDRPIELGPATRLAITLTPAQPERDALVRLVLVRAGHAVLLEPMIARGKAGQLELSGPAGELVGAAADGTGELVVVLGRALPDDDAVRALAISGQAPGELQVLRHEVVLAGFSHGALETLLGGCAAVVAPARCEDASGAQEPGCATVLPMRCEVAAGAQLALWVNAAAEVTLDGAMIAPAGTGHGGTSYEVAARDGTLTVRSGDRVAAWQLVGVAPAPAIAASDDARRAGRLVEAEATLDRAVAPEPAELLEIVRRRAKLARLRGQVEQERAWRDRAVVLARQLGRISVESDETVAILYGLMEQHALAAATQLLPALDAHGERYAEGAVRRDLVRGMLASELGELGTALAAFQRALATADRIGDTADRAAIVGPFADVLQSLGRSGETRALIDAELARGGAGDARGAAGDARGAAGAAGDVCAQVDALTNAGWLLRELDPPAAQRLADQAASLAALRCERLVPIALVNQGWLFAAARRFGEARAVLDRLAALHSREGRVTTWALRLEAEVLLGEDPASAAQRARYLAERAGALCSSELAYEAHLLRARAEIRLGHDAASALADADRALTVWSRLVPFGEGRATFFERHDQLARAAIPYWLARSQDPQARRALAEVVRRSLARFVGSLAGSGRVRALAGDDRDRASRQLATLASWPDDAAGGVTSTAPTVRGVCAIRDAASSDAGRDVEPGKLGAADAKRDAEAGASDPTGDAVFVHPIDDGWLVIAWRAGAIELRQVARAADPANNIAEAAAAMLAGAPRVQLHVHRSLAALPIDRKLAARLGVPVAFGVDAPTPAPMAACHGPRRALVVANPQDNLRGASDALPVVRGHLERLGLVVDVLEGAAATRAQVTAHLADPCTALFEYDGHAAARAGDRLDDALLLAGGEALTAADVLGLSRAPAAIVLDGCTTAAPEGLGLAQAFLLAGARQVIASLDDVPDAAAARFTRALFAGDGALDLVARFARATANDDLAMLRVFER